MNIDSASGMAEAKAWLQSVIRLLRDGAFFIIPRSNTRIRVCHSERMAEFEDAESMARERETVRVFQSLGWLCRVEHKAGVENHQLVLAA